MRRNIWIVLLTIGAVAGFTAGFHSLHRHAHHGAWGGRRAAFEARVADVCTQAAERVIRERTQVGERPPPSP